MASNGIGDLGKYDFMNKGMYPGSQIDRSQYATPTQIPLGAQAAIADYDPAINPLTGQPVSRFADGGIARYNGEDGSSVQTSFGYPNNAYMDLAYGYAHDPVRNAMMQARSEGVLDRYQGKKRNESASESEKDLKVRAMAMAGNPKYDPRYMPLQLDDRPMNPIQAALLRLQAQKQMGDGEARAGISSLVAALPGERGVRGMPGAYDVGYNTSVGPGNLDISAYRAMKAMPNGQHPYGVNARYSIPFNQGGIASFAYGGTPEEQRALISNTYQKILGRAPGEGEDITQWASQLGETGDTIELANRLAQTEEGTAYGKSNPNEVYKGAAELSQVSSPFKDTENPYSNMKYVASHTTPTTEDGQDGVTTHRFQDQNGGVITVGADGQPINYEPGRGWYDEQLRKNPDALRSMDYRNQTYLASGPLDKTYKFNGVDVPITAQEFQLDPKTKQFITGKTGDYAPVLQKDPGYDWFNDWGGPAMVAAIPLAAYAGTAMVGAGATGAGGAGGAGGGFGITAPSAGIPGLGVTQGSALVGTGAGAVGTAGTTAATTGGAYGAMGGIGGGAMGTGLTGGSGAAGGIGGLGGAGGATGMSTLGKMMATKMVLETLAGGGGQGGQPSAGPTSTTSYTSFNPNQGQNTPSIPSYNPTSSNPFAISGMTSKGNYGYDPLVYGGYGMNPRRSMAAGGIAELAVGGSTNLGSYSDGGHLLKGPGDGMSDHIPATIGGQQPARLAEGEFVVPADVVSHLGNGSTDAGAKQLYKMMDKIRKARTGNAKQGKQINPDKFFPKG